MRDAQMTAAKHWSARSGQQRTERKGKSYIAGQQARRDEAEEDGHAGHWADSFQSCIAGADLGLSDFPFDFPEEPFDLDTQPTHSLILKLLQAVALVPWMDDSISRERNYKMLATGVVADNFEHWGMDIRPGLELIWAGEENEDMLVHQHMTKIDLAAIRYVLASKQNLIKKLGAPKHYIPLAEC